MGLPPASSSLLTGIRAVALRALRALHHEVGFAALIDAPTQFWLSVKHQATAGSRLSLTRDVATTRSDPLGVKQTSTRPFSAQL